MISSITWRAPRRRRRARDGRAATTAAATARRPPVFCLAVAVVLALAGTTVASERSEQLYARGLVDFHAGRYQDALTLFQQAVDADPRDAYARYYRGVTYGRMGNYAAAEADLRAALEAHPQLEQAALELGIVLVKQDKFADAVPWLTTAQANPATYGEASLFLGIAQLRLNQLDAADVSFERASRTAALVLAAQYYRGLVAYRQQRADAARQHFTAVTEQSPDSAMGREAAIYLERLRGGAPTSGKPWVAYGSFALQYDTNVTLEPNDGDVAAAAGFTTGQSDGSAVLTAGAAYAPLRTKDMELLVGYEFYQSLYFNLDEFDLQDHRPSVQFLYRAGRVQLGLAARYDYYLLNTDSYFQGVNALPTATVAEGDFGETQVYFRYRWRDYYLSPFRGVLDGNNYSPGVLQHIFLGESDRYVSLGYRFDAQVPTTTRGAAFGYDGNEVVAGLTWPFPSIAANSDFAFTYRHRDYDAASNGRMDNEYLLTLLLEKRLTEQLSLVVGYLGIFNDSNNSLFSYTRQIVSAGVEARF